MRRLPLLLLVVCSGSTAARAETWLDLAPIPDLATLEPAYPVCAPGDHRRTALDGSLTLGFGDDAHAAATLAAGLRGEHVSGGIASELQLRGRDVARGRHRGRLLLQRWSDHADDFGASLELDAQVDHGDGFGLAPIALGPGPRDAALGRARGGFQLSDEDDDFVIIAGVEALAGASERPGFDRAIRRGGGLSLGRAPIDGELPRGSVDFLRGRVEHVSISRPVAAAAATDHTGASTAAPLGDAEVRIVELGLGPHDLTFHVDRHVLAVLDIDLGWSWLEADTAAGRIAENMLRARWGGALVGGRAGAPRRVGLTFGREPTYTPDGQRLVSEWRLALAAGIEQHRLSFDARGGISWATPIAGGGPADMLIRYGAQLEAFAKLGLGLEAGAQYAAWYEPAAGDPYAAPRRWTVEAALALRWRPSRARR